MTSRTMNIAVVKISKPRIIQVRHVVVPPPDKVAIFQKVEAVAEVLRAVTAWHYSC